MSRDIRLEKCLLCPRKCGVNRYQNRGFCGCGGEIRIARAALHMWEEPCISGSRGSGTVFFTGCNLKCCFCQNYEISAQNKGFDISVKELADIFLMLQEKGAHNINLVTPTPYVYQTAEALDLVKGQLNIPIVYNCGGYESIETLEFMADKVDIFLPDLKYFDSQMSEKYSCAEDYFEKASAAIRKMADITGKPVFDENGMMKKGVIVRHLVLPNGRHDSEKIIKWLSENFEKDQILVSVMSQYTPVYKTAEHKEINRRTSTFEYNYAADLLENCGFRCYFQERSSAQEEYIPEFFDHKYF